MFSFPLSLRSFCARFFRIVGPCVSGLKRIRGHVAPATIRHSQKLHLQVMVDMNPDEIGPSNGPNMVAVKYCLAML